ncbi:MAG: SH3 domain-containing protein, partial [Bacillota bacterium]|nr:SH3 domain-containing protein [Bacillota bacterium]
MKRKWTIVLASLVAVTSVMTVPARKASAAAQTPITRSQVEQRAISLVDLSWTYSSDKNSYIDPKYASSVTLPKQFQGVTTAQFTGIPYAWGGIDGVDTHSYNAPWTSF